MDRFSRFLGLIVLVSWFIGCGGTDPGTPIVTPAQPAVEVPSPDKVTHQFMMTIKTGDEQQAAILLTEKARREVERTGMDIMASGSQTMEFTVGDVEIVGQGKDGAHVAATISDFDADQKRVSNHVLWFLRKEPAGWRVAGIAIKIFAGEEPVLYNFEDPEGTARTQQLVTEEIERRAQAAAAPASNNPPAAITRKSQALDSQSAEPQSMPPPDRRRPLTNAESGLKEQSSPSRVVQPRLPRERVASEADSIQK